jgi:monoamine oxidase
MISNHDLFDVIVVGAGYAGLVAADTLVDAGKKVLLLEARDRVGGRVYTRNYGDGTYIDLGGQWVGPGQQHWYQLAKRAGIKTFPTYDIGKSTISFDKKVKRYEGLIPPLSVPALLSLNNAIKKINRLSSNVSLDAPWQYENAIEYDKISLSTWIDKQMWNNKAKRLFKVACESVFASDLSDISLLFALFYIHAGKDFDNLTNIRNGAQQDRFVGGADGPHDLLLKN